MKTTYNELWRLPATQLGAGYRAARFTPEDVLDQVLERVAQHNPHLNAIVTLDEIGRAHV